MQFLSQKYLIDKSIDPLSALQIQGEDFLHRFFDDNVQWISAYKTGSSFGFVALVENNVLAIRSGRLWMRARANNFERGYFRSKTIAAGHLDLCSLSINPKEFIESLVAGQVMTPDGFRLWLPPDVDSYSTFYTPIHEEASRTGGNRISVANLSGRRDLQNLSSPALDWELKAASPPFDSLQELVNHFGAGVIQGGNCAIEIPAFEVAAIDYSTTISEGFANIKVLLDAGLERSLFDFGYRVLSGGDARLRGNWEASDFSWREEDGLQKGEARLPVQPRDVVQCFARYAGTCQHQAWFADPTMTQNSARDIYASFDDNLSYLEGFLKQTGKANSVDFEAGVCWLLWMLGFRVIHLGGTPKTKDAPDLIALTPKGHVLVIECTTGLLKAENKIAKLHERAARVRRRLDISGHSNLKILPVVVTSLPREDIEGEASVAEQEGIVVIAQSELIQGLSRTVRLPDADSLFEEALNHVDSKSKQSRIEGF